MARKTLTLTIEQWHLLLVNDRKLRGLEIKAKRKLQAICDKHIRQQEPTP